MGEIAIEKMVASSNLTFANIGMANIAKVGKINAP
jgi:hypothetical protein